MPTVPPGGTSGAIRATTRAGIWTLAASVASGPSAGVPSARARKASATLSRGKHGPP